MLRSRRLVTDSAAANRLFDQDAIRLGTGAQLTVARLSIGAHRIVVTASDGQHGHRAGARAARAGGAAAAGVPAADRPLGDCQLALDA